ncbi:MAG: hypothetical protein PWP24_941 [Clostridiales bacterium]|nr:hypothetical protein [Clostridiales bacterium]
MNQKRGKLYNVIFPIWMLWLFPMTWFAVNFINFDMQTALGRCWYDNIVNPVNLNPFRSVYAVLWVTMCVVITAVFIYLFNYKFCLKKADMERKLKKKVALALAIFTAPYLFYLPTIWFYKGF